MTKKSPTSSWLALHRHLELVTAAFLKAIGTRFPKNQEQERSTDLKHFQSAQGSTPLLLRRTKFISLLSHRHRPTTLMTLEGITLKRRKHKVEDS